jgi:hypothetical protein
VSAAPPATLPTLPVLRLHGCSRPAACFVCSALARPVFVPCPERRRLFPCRQSPAERLETAKALMALLDPTSDTYGGPAAVDAFLCGGGPSIMKYRLDSMDGML